MNYLKCIDRVLKAHGQFVYERTWTDRYKSVYIANISDRKVQKCITDKSYKNILLQISYDFACNNGIN